MTAEDIKKAIALLFQPGQLAEIRGSFPREEKAMNVDEACGW